MHREHCAGIIPLRLNKDRSWEILLALHVNGEYWAFPKGHIDEDETPYKTAERELFEETNLRVDRLYEHAPLKEDYQFERQGVHIHKFIVYYPALVTGEVELKDSHEIQELKWFPLSQGIQQITFDLTRKMIEPLIQSLTLNV
jgi:bis(5'-nucleosidyl)-tetraphosphatase